MKDDIFIGRKYNIMQVIKHILVCLISLLALSYILGDALYLYANQYIYKEETKIIYELDKAVLHQDVNEYINEMQDSL